jgi:hypothetical protein
MNHMKMLGLLAGVAAALMGFAGTASATYLTSPSGTVYTDAMHFQSEGDIALHGPTTTTCRKSTFEGDVETHGLATTVASVLSKFTLEECNNHVVVENAGSLIIHTTGASSNGNGTVTSTGLTITIKTTSLNLHCLYVTEITDIGALTGSNSSNATLDIDSVRIPRHVGSIFCGSYLEWTGTYKVTIPSTLYVH